MLHADAMPHVRPKRYYHDISQSNRNVTNDRRYHDLRRPKKVTFFCNGDRYFKGKLLFITPHRYLSFQDLLGDLTGKLPASSSLPYGVRQIYTPVGGRRVREIEHLQDGKEYVCAGFETFKAISYGTHTLDPWSNGRTQRHVDAPSTLDLKGVAALPNASNLTGKSTPRLNVEVNLGRKSIRLPNDPFSQRREDGKYAAITKPKVITVVRAGRKPYANIKILLNRRSVQSYERLLSDISESFGPKWKSNKVRSLYTLTGREVLSISDFFRGDSVFLAVGNEKISFSDIQEIIENLYPDSPYAKSLLKSIEKRKKKAKHDMLQSTANENQEIQEKQTTEKPEKPGAGTKPNGVVTDNSDKENAEITKKRPKPKQSKTESPREGEPKEKQTPHSKDKTSNNDGENAGNDRLKKVRKPSRNLAVLQDKKPMEFQQDNKILPPIKPAEDDNVAKKSPSPEVSTKNIKNKVDLKTKRQLRQEKQKAIEKQEQEKREYESKAQVDIYKEMEEKLQNDEKSAESKEKVVEEKVVEEKVVEEKEKDGKDDKSNRDEKGGKDMKNEKDNKEEKSEKEEKLEKEEKKEKEPEVKTVEESPKLKPKIRYPKTRTERASQLDEIKEKYDIGRTLGDGNFALVKMCQHRETGHQYAMKIIDKSKLKGKEHMIDNEIAIMKACSQENLVKLLDEYETKEEIYLVLELVKGGDLFDAISQSVKFSESVASKMTQDMTNALFYLHSRGIVHRDLKPENLMVLRNKDESITLKLGDFGLAVEVKAPIFTICGTPTYVAPEILSEIGYGLEVDMWAVGVITYILLCGFPPFRSPDRNQSELFEFIKAGQYEFISPYWDSTSSAAKDLIKRLLVVDKAKRYAAIDVLCHPWVITMGNSKDEPADMPAYQTNLREELEKKAKENLTDWRSHRAQIFSLSKTTSSY